MKKHPKSRARYDIFISYRREGGLQYAVALQSMLLNMGYSVFLDVRDLSSGHFDTALLKRIETCKDFILILSDGALDRCMQENDWVCREIEYAMQLNKNIIPLIPDGKQPDQRLPHSLPDRIVALPSYQVFSIDLMQINAAVTQLHGALHSSPHPYLRLVEKALPLIAALLIFSLLAIGYGVYHRYTSVFPHNAVQRSIVSESISYLSFNLTHADVSLKAYDRALSDCAKYLNGNSTLTREGLQFSLNSAMAEIIKADMSIKELDSGLSARLDSTPISKGDIAMQETGIRVLLSSLFDRLLYLNDFLIDDEMLLPATKLAYVEACQEISSIDADLLFYSLNELLLPVDRSALGELLTQYLPNITTIYGEKVWVDSADVLQGIQESLYRRTDEAKKHLHSTADDEQRRTDAMKIRNEKLSQLTDIYAEVYARYSPSPSDTTDDLWVKGMRFMSFGMGDAAAECFALYAERASDPDSARWGIAAEEFAMRTDETGLSGGCIVCMYEPDKPRQPLEIGDVIFGVDGVPVYTFEEYDAALSTATTSPVFSVLRFSDGGYELFDMTYDLSAAGQIAVLSLCDTTPLF